jgi:hypothetical protein
LTRHWAKCQNRRPDLERSAGRTPAQKQRGDALSNYGFVKIFGSLLSSTVWVGQPAHRKLMWITMLVRADQDGYVASSIPGLARDSEVTIAECEDALAHFMAPDRYSRTKEHDGIRIEEVDGGWVLLNHKKYRELRSREAVLNARRQAKFKAERKQKASTGADVTGAGSSVASSDQPVTNNATQRKRSARRDSPEATVSPSVTDVTDVSANASNDQKQIQITDPDPMVRGGPKDLPGPSPQAGWESSTGERSRPPPPIDPPTVDEPTHVERFRSGPAPIIMSRHVPPEWEPKSHHETNCKLYGLVFEVELAKFRATEFKTPYGDWDKRFDRWCIDQRVDRETKTHQAQQRGQPQPRAIGTRPQPNHGVSGWDWAPPQDETPPPDVEPNVEPEPPARKRAQNG